MHLLVICTVGFELISLSLISINMPTNRSTSKETTNLNTDEVVESTLLIIPILSDTQLFIEKDLDITWDKVKDTFTTTNFKVDMEDRKAYINIHWSCFHRASCRFLVLTCANVIKWIFPHLDTKSMTLNNFSGQQLASYLAHDILLMYHLPKLEAYMDSYFYEVTNYLSTKDVIKTWVKEPTKFH